MLRYIQPVFHQFSSEVSATLGFSKFSLLRLFSVTRIGQAMSSKVEVEKEKYLTMPLEEKRHLYKEKTHVLVKDVKTWEDYFQENKERLQKQFASFKLTTEVDKYSVDPNLNKKVSVWEGNITHLEIDAIVNAANTSLLGGGGVDGAIHSAAGSALKAECATLHGCDTGDAKITGGYRLPAKYVIHTVGPRGEVPELLQSCYKTCFNVLTKNTLRVVAFPCISTGIYGYPNQAAAHIAIGTTRKFLEKNPDSIDRVIFCVFLKKDVEIYENLMQIYFPVV